MAKILIVDDSSSQRAQLKQDLEKAGFQVVEAADGLLGREVAKRSTDISLIISDVNMPQMGGIEMCEQIRAMEQYKDVPILMLTTEATAEMKAKGKQAGVTAWATKPYVADKLIKAAKQLVERRLAASAS